MTLPIFFLIAACFFLAYSNGANDNFKGVATLFGSGTTPYKNAIAWATVTTFAGSVCSIFLAETLVQNFTGKGLVPDSVAGSTEFLIAVAAGAGLTVMFASLIGFPISTTHSITGALFGGGFMAVGRDVNFAMLGQTFFLPLFVSPLIAVALAAGCYVLFRALRIRLGITKEYCICAGETETIIPIPSPEPVMMAARIPTITAGIDTEENCTERYNGRVLGINSQKALDVVHYLSGGFVGFARGLNDTPKIVALIVSSKALGIEISMVVVAVCMAAGGLLNARRVADTMSKKITEMNHGQGFTANLVTALLVGFASRLGVPVSTTHVSVGALFGIGLITRRANPRVIAEILLAWVMTLPLAALLSGLTYLFLTKIA